MVLLVEAMPALGGEPGVRRAEYPSDEEPYFFHEKVTA
jgi:hypothetical protein